MTIADIQFIRSTFRTPDMANYPELAGLSRNDIYFGKMGPGALYLAVEMVRNIKKTGKLKILDIGCGHGATSMFLAKKFSAMVFAVDLWVEATKNYRCFQAKNFNDHIVTLQINVLHGMPFPEEYFDIIFCMDCVHYFGGNDTFWIKTLKHLKFGGNLCIGSPCFSKEFSDLQLQNLPHEFDDGTTVWPKEFSKYHSPSWWESLILQTGMISNVRSDMADDGEVYWEDEVLYNLQNNGEENTALIDANQIRCRVEGYPYLTLFILTGERR